MTVDDTRDRIHEGFNRARLQIETRRALPSLPPIILGLVVTIVGAALILSQLNPTLFKSTREVKVAIDDAFGILEGVDEVRYRGVPAGTITKIEREDTQLVLRLKLRDDFPVYKDARAELRPETPLNDMYIDFVDPGTAAAGELGDATLPESRVDTSVKINDVLNTLQSNERTRLSQLLDNLGNGLQDQGAGLRAAVEEFTPFIARAGDIADALAARESMTKRLVHNASVLTTDLGTRERELRTLVREGSATLGTLQDSSRDLDQTLAELPATAREIVSSLRAVRGVVDDVDTAVNDLGPVADALPPALRTARRLNSELAPAVRRLQRPVRRLVPLVSALRPVSGDLSRVFAALAPRLPSIDKITKSVTACEDAIIHFFQWNASLSKFGDARAPIPRGNLAVGVPDSGAPGLKKRDPAENCAGGATTDGRVPTKEDEG